MKTLENTKTTKIKSIEVKYSNMTFVVEAYTSYVVGLRDGYWTKIKYSASIKESGYHVGGFGDKNFTIKKMELINSRPDLFLN
jgi:hypothetical protein